jgi:hypothetical protein
VIAKGNPHGDGAKLAVYLVTGKDGERAELVELRGLGADNIRDGFGNVEIWAEATRCEKAFFHCYVRLPEGEALERFQWRQVADRIEHQLGFDGQGRAVAFHHGAEGTHLHIAWSRIDLEHGRAIDPGLYKLKLKDISRQLEHEFGLTKVRNERNPEQKTLAPGRKEFEQARRLGTDLKAIRETIRDCWERSDTGRSFQAALAEHGYILARGDQRDFVVVDPAGGDHALGKRITGATAAETRARLADIDKQHLPSVEQAKAIQAERAAPEIAPQVRSSEIVLEAPAEAVQAREPAPADRPAPEINAPMAPAHDDSGVREPGEVAGRFASGVARALGAVLGALSDMIAPPPPPTRDQAQRMERAADEQAVARAAADEEARHRAQLEQLRSDDLARRRELEEQLRRDLAARERDDDYSRGRERER